LQMPGELVCLELFALLLVTALVYNMHGVSRLVQPLRYPSLQNRIVYLT